MMIISSKKNQLISKLFLNLFKINEGISYKSNSKPFFSLFFKKNFKTHFGLEKNLAKVCWKKLSEFNKILTEWKIINNSPFNFKGIKSKKIMINQKKKLKNFILRRN
jgi:hypothetical protein